MGTWKPEGDHCGSTLSRTSVVGGENAKVGDFPYMALLTVKASGPSGVYRADCGGSVINAWYVLTAAHCVDYKDK